ncbi:hypothetical protein M0804_014897 [Polistes exclamans]|nr:hypothetical protein M0804_014899 [Polistes exclamans]KAI4474358.1 hypothetical protein M0804_014897 [Polistes exclamans]
MDERWRTRSDNRQENDEEKEDDQEEEEEEEVVVVLVEVQEMKRKETARGLNANEKKEDRWVKGTTTTTTTTTTNTNTAYKILRVKRRIVWDCVLGIRP